MLGPGAYQGPEVAPSRGDFHLSYLAVGQDVMFDIRTAVQREETTFPRSQSTIVRGDKALVSDSQLHTKGFSEAQCSQETVVGR